MNAYVEDDELVLVLRDDSTPSGVRVRRQRAEHSCLIERAEVPEFLPRALRDHPSVRSTAVEGDWLRVRWRNRSACQRYCERLKERGIQTYEGGVDPVLRHMADTGAEVGGHRLAYLDLETDSRVPFSRMREARILCWALVSGEGGLSGVLAEDTDAAERELLRDLWAVLDFVDLVAAWNGDRFDFPVLRARTMQRGISVPWRRWLWLDHLELFRRMNMMAAESGDEKQSYALGAIAQAVLGEGKDDLDASRSWDYWAAGGESRERLRSYNLKDVGLMQRLEDKTGYVALLRTLAEACGTFPDTRGINPTVQTESLLQRLAVQRGHRFPTVGRRGEAGGGQFRGAYVMEPAERGIVRNVHVADFSSLYPTIIRTWNMSPETKRGPWGDPKTIDGAVAAGREAWPRRGECVAPITGVVFDLEPPEGMLAGAVAEMMRLRRQWSEAKASAVPGTVEWTDADRRSTAYKIAANSCYGAVGLPVFRHYDREVAESVSQCAVWLIQQTIRAAEQRGLVAVYADTDSAFVSGCTREEFERFVGWCNDELYPRILRCVGCEPGLISLAYEKAFERVIFVQKKRYIGRYAHFKGTAATKDSKPEVKGLEYKRGDSIRLARRMQEEAVNLLVGQEGGGVEEPGMFEVLLAEWRTRILERPLELEDVVIVKGLSKQLKDYARKLKKDGTVARQLPHIEVARVLEQRGRDVGEGAKIAYVIVDGRAKPMQVIPAEDWAGEVDRDAAWESLVAPPTIRLLQAAFPGHDWKPWERARPGEVKVRRRKKKEPEGPTLF